MITKPPSRCWFQFSLASLIWLMACAAIASYGYSEQRERVRLETVLNGVDLDVPYDQWRSPDFETQFRPEEVGHKIGDPLPQPDALSIANSRSATGDEMKP